GDGDGIFFGDGGEPGGIGNQPCVPQRCDRLDGGDRRDAVPLPPEGRGWGWGCRVFQSLDARGSPDTPTLGPSPQGRGRRRLRIPHSATGAHSTASIRGAPVASITSRSKPSATPLASGINSSAAR